MTDKLHIRPSEGPCEVHNWTPEELLVWLVPLLRERHGKRGANVCHECIGRVCRLRDALAKGER